MNRRIVHISILLFCLLVGVLFFIGSAPKVERPVGAQTVNSATVFRSNTNAAPSPEPVEDDFAPELGDIPTYDEFASYEGDRSSAATNLIEVSEAKATDDPWPSFSRDEIEGVRSGKSGSACTRGVGLCDLRKR
jgi:hypothetical protein